MPATLASVLTDRRGDSLDIAVRLAIAGPFARPVTFGVGRRDRVERVVVTWPRGRVEEFKNLSAGRAYECVEGKGIGDWSVPGR